MRVRFASQSLTEPFHLVFSPAFGIGSRIDQSRPYENVTPSGESVLFSESFEKGDLFRFQSVRRAQVVEERLIAAFPFPLTLTTLGWGIVGLAHTVWSPFSCSIAQSALRRSGSEARSDQEVTAGSASSSPRSPRATQAFARTRGWG